MKSIYVSHSKPANCKLKYKWYDSNKYYFYLSCMYSVIIIPFCIIVPLYYKYRGNPIPPIHLTNNIIECITNIFIRIIHIVSVICWISTIFIVDYYAYYLYNFNT